MQRDAEAKPFDGAADRILQVCDAGAGLVSGFEHARADLLLVADILVDRKNGEQAVAHVFEHLAAVLPDRGDLAVEILVEDVDHGLRRYAV